VFFCSRFVQDDVEEVVLIEAVSEDEALDVLIRREKGLEGIWCEVVGWMWIFVVVYRLWEYEEVWFEGDCNINPVE
jgi:hypothetical protein